MTVFNELYDDPSILAQFDDPASVASITSSALQIRGVGLATSYFNQIVTDQRYTFADGSLRAEWSATSGTPGIYLRYNTEGNTGYLAYLSGANELRIGALNNGTLTTFSNVAYTVPASFNGFLEFTASGNTFTATLYDTDGTTVLATTSDTNTQFQSAGHPAYSVNKDGTMDVLSSVIDDGATVTSSITITTPNYTFVPSNGGNQTINIEGTYQGSPTSIEFSVNGGAYSEAVASPTGNVFNHALSLPDGQYTVVYRFSDQTEVNATITPIAVAFSVTTAGQSNMSSRGVNNQTFSDNAGGATAFLYGNDNVFKQLEDPYDSSVGQVDLVSEDTAAGGSWMVRFADKWLTNSNVPIGIMPCADGSTYIAQWQKTNTSKVVSGLNLYQSMTKRINAVGGTNVVFMQLGESDCNIGTSKATYKAEFKQFADDVLADFGVETFIVPLHTLTAASVTTETATTGQTVIREAQIELAAENAHIKIGQPLTDIDLSIGDGLHFTTDVDLDTIATRVYASYAGSNLTLSITGIPDGTYQTVLFSGTTEVFNSTLTYASGAATTPALSVEASTALTGYVIDNEATHVDGAVITGTTV